jgi:hypothetical protein
VAYRRHVAYNNASTLYIVDLDKLVGNAPSANLEVTQSAPGSFEFASGALNLTVGITNRGPSATDVILTDTISSGSAQLVDFFPTSFSAASPLVRSLGTIGPGQGLSYSLSVRPGATGPFTNTILLTTTNTEPAQTLSTQIVNVFLPPGPVLTIRDISARDVAYDAVSGKLFVASAQGIRVIDPQAPAILPDLSASPARLVETPASGGALFVQFSDLGQITRIDLADSSMFGFGAFTLIDLVAAPNDTHLIAEVRPTSTQIIRDFVTLANITTATGPAQFSSDGTKFYLVNAANCVLNVFNINQNGLILAQTRTNASCSAFTEADGLLYFDGGVIYDPVADKRSTIGIPPPVLMLARGNQILDTLSRSNGIWTLRRLAGADHHLVRSLPLTMLGPSDGISLFKPAGADRVAMTSGSTLYIIDLAAPSQLSLTASLKDPATLTVRFDSTLGAIYRIETASTLGASTWTMLQDNIVGTGGIIETPIPLQPQQKAFVRAVRQSQ